MNVQLSRSRGIGTTPAQNASAAAANNTPATVAKVQMRRPNAAFAATRAADSGRVERGVEEGPVIPAPVPAPKFTESPAQKAGRIARKVGHVAGLVVGGAAVLGAVPAAVLLGASGAAIAVVGVAAGVVGAGAGIWLAFKGLFRAIDNAG